MVFTVLMVNTLHHFLFQDRHYHIQEAFDKYLIKEDTVFSLNWYNELSDNNTYSVELDTMYNKRIRISTAKTAGEDYQYEVDSDGLLALVYPESWIFINDRVAGYYCVDNYSDPSSDAWSQTGICPVLINDYEAFLYIYFDNEYPSGTILGYYFCDFEDGIRKFFSAHAVIDHTYSNNPQLRNP